MSPKVAHCVGSKMSAFPLLLLAEELTRREELLKPKARAAGTAVFASPQVFPQINLPVAR